jgi:hypothetical protein
MSPALCLHGLFESDRAVSLVAAMAGRRCFRRCRLKRSARNGIVLHEDCRQGAILASQTDVLHCLGPVHCPTRGGGGRRVMSCPTELPRRAATGTSRLILLWIP